MKTIKKITEYLPILYLIIVFFGYIEKSNFYSKFDINIYYFLNISELLFPIYKLGSFLVFMSPIFIQFIILKMIERDKLIKYLGINYKANKKFEHIQISNNWKIIFNRFLFAFLLLFPFYILFFIRNGRLIKYNILINLMSIFWFIAFIIVTVFVNYIKERNTNRLIISILPLFIYALIINSYNQNVEIDLILNGKSNTDIEVKYNNLIYKNNDSLRYIGRTKDFIFYRNLIKEETVVLPVSSLDKFIIRNEGHIGFNDISLYQRNWDYHPYLKQINKSSEINENITKISRRNNYIILNAQYVLPHNNTIIEANINPEWLEYNKISPNQNPLLRDINAPYHLIKNENDDELLLVKKEDTLRFKLNE